MAQADYRALEQPSFLAGDLIAGRAVPKPLPQHLALAIQQRPHRAKLERQHRRIRPLAGDGAQRITHRRTPESPARGRAAHAQPRIDGRFDAGSRPRWRRRYRMMSVHFRDLLPGGRPAACPKGVVEHERFSAMSGDRSFRFSCFGRIRKRRRTRHAVVALDGEARSRPPTSAGVKSGSGGAAPAPPRAR
jgi:hypothetical protein